MVAARGSGKGSDKPSINHSGFTLLKTERAQQMAVVMVAQENVLDAPKLNAYKWLWW